MRAWSACLLLFALSAPAPAADPDPPPLAFEPRQGPRGTILTLTGFDFGESPGSRTLALQRRVSERKHVGIELQVVRWEAGRVEARVPEGQGMSHREFHVVLLDRTGRPVAMSREPFRLTAGRAATRPAAEGRGP